MIRAINVSKKFRIKNKKKIWEKTTTFEKDAVKKINIQIAEGKIVGLLGKNGAGKTTTIKMLSTMLVPTQGEIYIDDIDIVKNPFEAKKVINIVNGGERNLYWRLSAQENLEYFGSLYGLRGDKLQERINECLRIVGLENFREIPVERYSKGMKQRLQIARGIINNPKYIFMDEPTIGLDVIMAKELREYIKKLAKEEEKGILLTTHYISEADELCDYIYVINEGEIVAEGTPEEIKGLYKTYFVVEYVFDSLPKEFLNQIKEDVEIERVCVKEELNLIEIVTQKNYTSEIIEKGRRFGINVLRVQSKEPSLEDALVQIVSKG